MPQRTDFLVQRSNLEQCTFLGAEVPEPQPGQILLEIDRFAFTANNITYALLGDRLAYWRFFPAPGDFGNVPVWGFGNVTRSRAEGIAEGERVFGYLPMSTHLVVQPVNVGASGFSDGMEHRGQLPPVYNRYQRTTGDPGYVAAYEDHQALVRPLFVTSFLIADMLAEHDYFGAGQVVISSASAKTAYGLAHVLRRSHPNVRVVGLTSAGNKSFVESLGCYHDVAAYEDIAGITVKPAVLVDFTGSAAMLATLHGHYRDSLKYSCLVGLSHGDTRKEEAALPGPQPVFFFAPDRIRKRSRDWGPGGIDSRCAEAWRPFVADFDRSITIEHGKDRAAVARVYRETLAGRVHPKTGHMLTLQA